MQMQHLFAAQSTAKPTFVTKNDVAHTVLEKSRLDDLPFVEAQEELELLFDKNQLNKRIRDELDTPEFSFLYLKAALPKEVDREFCLSLCIQMCIHKRASASTLVGILYHHYEDGRGRQEAMQATADALEACVHANFVDYSLKRQEFVVRLQMTAQTQQDLDRYQYPLPMMTKPEPIRHNHQNGYRLKITSNSLVVLKCGRESSFYETADLCLDHLNRVNEIPLTLNLQVVTLIDNEWTDLDRRRRDETHEEYERRVKAFEKYDENSKDVIHALSQLRDKFWLTHKYDRRGRVYCQGYHVTYQGNPWNKASIEFANKEEIKI